MSTPCRERARSRRACSSVYFLPFPARPRGPATCAAVTKGVMVACARRDVGRVFCEFLEVAVHQILFIRSVYPAELFERKRLVSWLKHAKVERARGAHGLGFSV